MYVFTHPFLLLRGRGVHVPEHSSVLCAPAGDPLFPHLLCHVILVHYLQGPCDSHVTFTGPQPPPQYNSPISRITPFYDHKYTTIYLLVLGAISRLIETRVGRYQDHSLHTVGDMCRERGLCNHFFLGTVRLAAYLSLNGVRGEENGGLW